METVPEVAIMSVVDVQITVHLNAVETALTYVITCVLMYAEIYVPVAVNQCVVIAVIPHASLNAVELLWQLPR